MNNIKMPIYVVYCWQWTRYTWPWQAWQALNASIWTGRHVNWDGIGLNLLRLSTKCALILRKGQIQTRRHPSEAGLSTQLLQVGGGLLLAGHEGLSCLVLYVALFFKTFLVVQTSLWLEPWVVGNTAHPRCGLWGWVVHRGVLHFRKRICATLLTKCAQILEGAKFHMHLSCSGSCDNYM